MDVLQAMLFAGTPPRCGRDGALSRPATTVRAVQIQAVRPTESTREVVEQINFLIPQLKPSWEPITVASLAQVIDSPTRVYVARYDGAIVGITLLVPHRHLHGPRYHVEDVVVDDQFRRQGVASKLLSVGMRDAPEEVISFDVRSHGTRQAAHALYLRLGFTPSDTTVFRRII